MPWFWALWPPLPPSPDLSWRRWSCKPAYLRWGLLSSQQSLTTTLFLLFSRMIFAFSARLTLPRGAPLAIQWMLDKPKRHFPARADEAKQRCLLRTALRLCLLKPSFLSHTTSPVCQVLSKFSSQRLGIHPTPGPAAAAVATLGSASLLEQFSSETESMSLIKTPSSASASH